MKRECPEHPKTKDLIALLGVHPAQAIGHLELLFIFAADCAPCGNIGKWRDAVIAKACKWDGNPQVFIKSLIQAGYVNESSEYRLLLHDWPDHAPDYIRKRMKRNGLEFVRSVTGQFPVNDWSMATTLPPTQPNPTQPSTPEALILNSPVVNTQPLRARACVSDLTESNGQNFGAWWNLWSSVRGTPRKMQAAQAYLSVVTITLEKACFECTASYLKSSMPKNGGGFNPDKFLFEQATDGFAARWPAFESASEKRNRETGAAITTLNRLVKLERERKRV